ncbi:MAG: NAD(P)-dependent oxidoreductase [Alphaproteobacteria bacterium]|nr:NAD(P)-dependent oxidoreductase [Alphaproteobacteria bacterium]
MAFANIGIVSMGDMGHAIARTLREGGHRVRTALDGRSGRTRALAEAAGIEDAGTLAALVPDCDLILSILPPAAAPGLAQSVVDAGLRPGTVFVDCNAIAPATTRAIGAVIEGTGATFVDGGIIGSPPGRHAPTRLYVSGPDAASLQAISRPDLLICDLGSEIGAASGLKMCYAALTKGTMTLDTLVLLGARALGLEGALMAEFADSQETAKARMERSVPWLAADAARWVGEMEEIARTFADEGFTSRMHEGAADVFRLLAQSTLAAETRETADRTRTLDDAIAAFLDASPSASGRDAAD